MEKDLDKDKMLEIKEIEKKLQADKSEKLAAMEKELEEFKTMKNGKDWDLEFGDMLNDYGKLVKKVES